MDLTSPCNDCQVDTMKINEWYMIKHEVWPLQDEGYLCVGCCEERLGRKLERKDFLLCPGILVWNWSDRLKNRFGKQELTEEETEELKILMEIITWTNNRGGA